MSVKKPRLIAKNKNSSLTSIELPPIPTKIYFTIGEVSKLCELKTHVLRYWEVVFPSLSPSKRRGRRYYKRDDIILIRYIRELLYEQGFTIDGARSQLHSDRKSESNNEAGTMHHRIKEAVHELEEVLVDLDE
jgi:DNA-binding transcriptional MerR regulator